MIRAEICANSPESAIAGQKGGAYRVELCDNLQVGGITPIYQGIKKTIQSINIQTNILIRPRQGDFVYSKSEFEQMKKDICFCGDAGCNGVVFGILDKDGFIDKKRNCELIQVAWKYNMNATFHRAIDQSADIFKSLENVIEIGFDRILTSGGKESALEGKYVIKRMIELAGGRIIIMPGGGITEDNIFELTEATGLKEFHGSFRNIEKDVTDYYKVQQAIKNANAKHL